MLPDAINGCFEMSSALLLWLNVAAIARDKCVRGVHAAPTAIFTAWGMWNLFYYPHLGQWISFAGGVGLVTANAVWLSQVWRYSHAKWRASRHVVHGGDA